MMREILFRGRTTQGKEWISGYYAKSSELHFIWGRNSFGAMLMFEVDPETVGQFTGLIDKNGKKVFEGDIVRCNRTMCDSKEMVGHIAYDDCCFSVKENKTPNQPAMDLCDDFEVIGNIHDNPELLEV